MEEFNVKETPEIFCEKCGGRIYRSLEVLSVANPWYVYYCDDCGYVYHSHAKDETIPIHEESFNEIKFIVDACEELSDNTDQNNIDVLMYCVNRLLNLLNKNNDAKQEREILLLIRRCFSHIKVKDQFTEDVYGRAYAIM